MNELDAEARINIRVIRSMAKFCKGKPYDDWPPMNDLHAMAIVIILNDVDVMARMSTMTVLELVRDLNAFVPIDYLFSIQSEVLG